MSELYREQHPLLCDEVSEEEHFSPHYQRRFRPMIYRGRARNQAKGATAIINQWPDHWTSSVTYWWIALGMITFTVLILYNSVIALALLPSSTHLRPTNIQTAKKIEKTSNGRSSLPDVFMHILVNSNEEVNLDKYLPSIEILSNKYSDYKYNFIIVVNDTSETDTISAEEHNDIAFNSLWSKERIYEKQKVNKNIHIQRIPLSSFMNTSPLKKDWRHLPHQYIEFLVKAISIWNKGGIAFNPSILSVQSAQHAVYNEKLENIFQKYQRCNENSTLEIKIKKHINKQKDKQKKRVNNIQDIIDILEHEDGSSNSTQYSLAEAENRHIPYAVHNGRKLLSTEILTVTNNQTETESFNDIVTHSNVQFIKMDETGKQQDDMQIQIEIETHDTPKTNTLVDKAVDQSLKNNRTTKLSLLPLFLEFLFHDRSKDKLHKANTEETTVNNLSRHRKSAISLDNLPKNSTISPESEAKSNEKFGNVYKSIIVSAKDITRDKGNKKLAINDISIECEHRDQLTIDLKGNILATETACHAFIGSVFSNVIHHTEEETLNDFIIAELSDFCKGLLSSCKGIDVILP